MSAEDITDNEITINRGETPDVRTAPAETELTEEEIITIDTLYSNRNQYLIDNNHLDQANVEALFASSSVLLAVSKLLSNKALETSKTQIPLLISNLAMAFAGVVKKINTEMEATGEDTKLPEEEINRILELLQNVNVTLPEGL